MKDTYAILKLSGLQYLVREGDVVDVKKAKKLSPNVLLLNENGKVTVGTPVVKGAKVDIEIEKEFNDKVEVRRYKSKSRYRVTKGFKYPMQRLVIKKISGIESKKAVKKTEPKKDTKPKAKKTSK